MHVRHLTRTAAVSLALASTLLMAGGAGAAEVSGWEVSLSGDSPAGSLMSVSSVDDDLAWAVGRKDGYGVIMRWDGEQWSEDTAPGLPDVWQWSSVSAVSADDVWAYGTVGRDQALVHYDGERWNSVAAAGPADDSWPEVPLDAVPGRLFKGGNALYTYSDGAWQTFALPALVDIRDIDAISADDAYATGMRYPVDSGHPVTYHWDGETWSLMDQPPVRTGTDTAKITAVAPDDVYVAGWADGPDAGPPVPSVAHWDGTAWEDITGELADLYLHAIAPDGRGGLWVTGNDQAEPANSEAVFWHFDGTTWTKEAGAPAPDGDTRWPSYTFYDLAPAGTSGEFWAVGDYSTPMDSHGDQTVNGLIERSTTPAGTPAGTPSD
ncbi:MULTISPECIES: hypothetical protein [Streptomyces]|uniref:Uncharacterized protein n=1 Tax=Streptomyces glycanivorans TaxID=3033808 RepID=A0ABY9JBR5_9ACTN|nr:MULTISPECIES: hypothetical protein [unclassified Streptomyces]TXS15927.1 hypothetical protein EAO68_16445 [Streptomyces sp. wa22]WLQ65238.1 hypothetical protein P8A20_17295 [Streptomyces sp. Alt3]